MTSSQVFPEQAEARRLLDAALAEGPAHAYLFHGPPGVGKRRAALGFAGALLGDPGRVERRAHPDLYVLEPLGDQIRIDAIRELRHDLHMRPVRGRPPRLPRLRRAHAERGGRRRAAQGPRGAAAVRGRGARRRRSRAAVGDDPVALPARLVPSAGGARRFGGRSWRARRSCPTTRRLRSHVWLAGASTGSTACSTRRRRAARGRARGRALGLPRSGLRAA